MSSQLTTADLTMLLAPVAGPCLSIYLPALGEDGDTRQAPIRFKTLLRQAEERLTAAGYPAGEVDTLLAPAMRVLEDTGFWQHQAAGLAAFRTPTVWHAWFVPRAAPEQVMLGGTFYLSPLLPLFDEDGPFFLLALSENDVRLYEGSRDTFREIVLPPAVPRSLAEVARFEDPDRQSGFHTDAPRQGSGRRSAVFYGHGGTTDFEEALLRQYCQQIDHGLRPLLGTGTTPLVLAGVESLLAVFRAGNSYPHLLADGVLGNPEAARRPAEELHRRGWAIVAPVYQARTQQEIDQFHQVAGTGRTSGDLTDIVPAAHQGRVATLFLADGEQRWGRFDSALNTVSPATPDAPDAEELLNLAAVQTLRNGGAVHVLPPAIMPTASVLAAVYRY
jgi:hypothetical protein